MKTPAPFTRLLLGAAAAAALAACQKAPEAAPAPAAASAPSPVAAASQPKIILGGLQPGDTVTVSNCLEPQPGVCSIGVVATAPAGGSGDACTVTVASAVSLPKTTATLRWQLTENDANYSYRFRAASGNEKPGFGIFLIDNDMYAPNASGPMQPIWATQVQQPLQVEMSRTVRLWPPRISAYNVYLEYQAKGATAWTACKTWDPIIISRD